MRTRTLLTILAVLIPLILPQSAFGQNETRTPGIDSIFSSFDNTRSPGCVVGVVRSGELEFAAGYGMANLELGIPLGPKSVLRTGSVSKQFAATVIALLAQEGVLSLDDPVQRYIPELPEYGAPVTIRHLIHHTSGIRDYLALMALAGKRDDDWYDEEELLAMLARQENLNFPTGSAFLYSNSGYFLLSQIVLRATGRTLAEVAEEKLFGPLGMTHTRFQDDHRELVPNRASGYEPEEEGRFRISMTTLNMVGDGGVFTSIQDLLHWLNNFEDPRVGGQALMETIHSRGVLNSGDTLTYAFGQRIGSYRGLPTVAHGGSFVGFRADITRFPENDLSVATLCNLSTTNPSRFSRRVAEVYLEDLMEPVEESESGARGPREGEEPEAFAVRGQDLIAYAGDFYSPELDVIYRIELQGDSLVVHLPGTETIALTPREEDVFQAGYWTLRFSRNDRGLPASMLVDAGRVRGIRFHQRDRRP